MLLPGRLLRLGYDLFCGSDGLLGFRLLHPGSCGMRFLDQLGGLGIGLHQDFVALRFGPSEFDAYLLPVRKSLRDLPAPLLQHFENWFVRKPVKNKADNAEADNLRNQVRPVHPKGTGNLLDLSSAIDFRQQN